jgi:transglutaminase-like putative cysteine protease
MNRRDFLSMSGMASASLGFAKPGLLNYLEPSDNARIFEVTTSIEVLKPSGITRIWVPIPVQETPFQRVIAKKVSCGAGKTHLHVDQGEQLRILAAEYPAGARPILTSTTRIATRDWSVDTSTKSTRDPAHQASTDYFLRPTRYVPTDGIVQRKAMEIVGGLNQDSDKARALYDWIVDNTYRNPKVRGCGRGDIRAMLESGDLGGKCADLNALYVGLARSVGLPARDVYGIRIGSSKKGYKSLGTASAKVTKAQHCRAEVYLKTQGWVPVDPADVRKVMLEEPPGPLPTSDPKVQSVRERLFGSWEMNWMAYNYAQDVVLPGSSGPAITYFMYPQAETAEGRLDSLDPEAFRYEITSDEKTFAG